MDINQHHAENENYYSIVQMKQLTIAACVNISIRFKNFKWPVLVLYQY